MKFILGFSISTILAIVCYFLLTNQHKKELVQQEAALLNEFLSCVTIRLDSPEFKNMSYMNFQAGIAQMLAFPESKLIEVNFLSDGNESLVKFGYFNSQVGDGLLADFTADPSKIEMNGELLSRDEGEEKLRKYSKSAAISKATPVFTVIFSDEKTIADVIPDLQRIVDYGINVSRPIRAKYL